jgi:hypothetical protein
MALAAASMMGLGANQAQAIIPPAPTVREIPVATKRVPPRKLAAREAGAARDPYFGIKSRGRKGAAVRADLMADAFRRTKVGKRAARGRDTSNPFACPVRRACFSKAVTAGHARSEAMKIARRAAA